MQDLSKIEQEHLQANDVGDDVQNGLTREFAEDFSSVLKIKLSLRARNYFSESGMREFLSDSEYDECMQLFNNHLDDAIGDMPIWDFVKRGDA